MRTGTGSDVWAVNLETGGTRSLPGIPAWSPGGERLAYLVPSTSELPFGSLWLAGIDWDNPRHIADEALFPGDSPGFKQADTR